MFHWTDEQNYALDAIDKWSCSGEPFFSLTGPAGTGKSTLLREVAARFTGAHLAAMTGKAALRLSQCTGQTATTLHSVLYYPPKPGESVKFTRTREPESSIYTVDESSMLTPVIFNDMKKWARQGVKFLLVGDSFQLPPVITAEEAREHGQDYSVFCFVKGVELKTVLRNAGGVLRAATKVRETGQICRESDEGYEYLECNSSMEKAVDDYCNDMHDHLLITWRNAVRMAANRMVRQRLGHEGELPDEGEPVLIRRNGGGYLNGEIVICGGFEVGPKLGSMNTLWMTVKGNYNKLLVSYEGKEEFFDGQTPWIENWKKYHIDLNKACLNEPVPISWGYVLTGHQCQGSQARRTTVFLQNGDERSSNFLRMTTLPSGEKASTMSRWCYTAQTRSVERTTMIVGR